MEKQQPPSSPSHKRQRTTSNNSSPTDNNGNTTVAPSLPLDPGIGLGLALASELYPHLTQSRLTELTETARRISTRGKGITACDESSGTLGGRFEAVGIINSEENRIAYRTMLLDTDGIEEYLCGAILDVETLLQKSKASNKLFPQALQDRGIVPGVKPHLKVYTLPGTGGDTVMQGLDSLAVRARQYYAAGARFAKWRSPIEIDTAKGRPTELAINANMSDLARYALICQSEGLMPIVEPDVVLAGTHSLAVAVEVNVRVQAELFHAMRKHGVYMAGTTLKPNMVLPGLECPVSYSVEDIARANAFVMEQCLPAALTSVNYLSGGQSLTQALVRLNAIAQHTRHLPWNTSFSWSKALQLPLLELCGEKKALCLQEMGCLYIEELKLASLASLGTLIDDEYTTINEDDNGDHKGV